MRNPPTLSLTLEKTGSRIAEEGLRRIQELYAIEADIKGETADTRRAARQMRSQPLLDAFHTWAVTQRRQLSGKARLGKALQYSLSRWDALTRYVEDGRLSIDVLGTALVSPVSPP